MKIVRTVKALRKEIAGWRQQGDTVALVPTMGALHEGHLSLVKLARRKAKRAVVSIFVNPTQFAPTEDLARYPRDEAGDAAKLAGAGADLVWAPDVAEMYPGGFSVSVKPGTASLPLEGTFRPHHFGGVATVCCKLFNQVTPDVAIFGEKDFQQLAVLRQMVRDLDMGLKLIGAPTKREKDGLALSSRNAYLSADERKIAPTLNAAIVELAAKAAAGRPIPAAIEAARKRVLGAGFTSIDYITVADANTLTEVSKRSDQPLRVLAAVWLSKTRLIDNVPV
jgi:pantoate--beta-alanine ligase